MIFKIKYKQGVWLIRKQKLNIKKKILLKKRKKKPWGYPSKI